MYGRPLFIDGKVVGRICGPRPRRVPCSVTGCPNARIYLCDFPLAGAKAGKTCSRGLCEKHRGRECVRVEACGWRGTTTGDACPECSDDLAEEDFCPAHVKLEPKADPPTSLDQGSLFR